jgi:hypothetical protein
VTAPYFCATKIVAFHGRGKDDYTGNHDLEDFLAVVDGRLELISEIHAEDESVRAYLATEVTALLAKPQFIDALPGFLLPDQGSQARLPMLLDRLGQIVRG